MIVSWIKMQLENTLSFLSEFVCQLMEWNVQLFWIICYKQSIAQAQVNL